VLFLIAYQPAPDVENGRRAQIEERITEAAPEHLRVSPWLWLVDTDDSVDTWTGRLSPPASGADRLVVVRVNERSNGWLTNQEWQWINNHTS
jgi:hypothetical protein